MTAVCLAAMLAGCAAGPDPRDREANATDAYIQQVEANARNSSSPTQVHWANPPSFSDSRKPVSLNWSWKTPGASESDTVPDQDPDQDAVPMKDPGDDPLPGG